jgi:hypothetical protein
MNQLVANTPEQMEQERNIKCKDLTEAFALILATLEQANMEP